MNISLTEQIHELAKQNGTSFSGIEKALHFGNGTIRAWDQSKPSYDKVVAVADFFGVSIDTLVGRASGDYIAEDERQLLALFRSMNAEGRAYLMQTAEMASGRFLKTSSSDREVTA